jgi:NAD(P)-dependent dehydrogenase (short-subunit alcohol dehydrogenase family)
VSRPVAVVTGGNRGIGYEVCRQLAEGGFDVVLGSRDGARGEAAAAGLGVAACQLDVADDASVRAAAASVSAQFGRCDALVNNAILVNSICPGWVATDMGGPGGRRVADGAASVVWGVTLPDDGPTGGFFRDGRPVDW